MNPKVTSFFDDRSKTLSYVVQDTLTSEALIIDSVLDCDPETGQISTESADKMIRFVDENELNIVWIIETHILSEHLSAASYLRDQLGGNIGIGEHNGDLEQVFLPVIDKKKGDLKECSGKFDLLFRDGDLLPMGALNIEVMHTPSFTSDGVSYLIGDAAFVGDTLHISKEKNSELSASENILHLQSIQKISALPDETRIYPGHDYKFKAAEIYKGILELTENKSTFYRLKQDR